MPEPRSRRRKSAPPAKSRRGAKAAEKAEAEPAPNAPRGRHAGRPRRQDTGTLKQDARLVNLLRNSVEAAAGEDGWSMLGSVGKQIGNQASFDPRNYGYKKLIDLIEATQLFDIDRRASHMYVRDKRQGKAGAPTGHAGTSRHPATRRRVAACAATGPQALSDGRKPSIDR